MKSDYIKGKKAEWDAPIPQHICKTCTHGKPHVDGKSIWCKKYESPKSRQGFCASWETSPRKS